MRALRRNSCDEQQLRTATKQMSIGSASRKTTMPRDRLSVFLHSTTLKRQLVTLDHEATFVETWHVQFQTTHQNRCLHGFGERRGALIPHLVVVEIEELQDGVGLAMRHRSDHTTQQTAERMLSHNVAPACEDSQNLSATTRPVCCTSTCRLNLPPTTPR